MGQCVCVCVCVCVCACVCVCVGALVAGTSRVHLVHLMNTPKYVATLGVAEWMVLTHMLPPLLPLFVVAV